MWTWPVQNYRPTAANCKHLNAATISGRQHSWSWSEQPSPSSPDLVQRQDKFPWSFRPALVIGLTVSLVIWLCRRSISERGAHRKRSVYKRGSQPLSPMDNHQKRKLTFFTIGLIFILSGVEYGKFITTAFLDLKTADNDLIRAESVWHLGCELTSRRMRHQMELKIFFCG